MFQMSPRSASAGAARLLAAAFATAALLGALSPAVAGDLEVGLSSHECLEGSHEQHRVCFLNNVFFYQGKVHYVAKSADVTLPRMRVGYWVAGEQLDYLQPVIVTPSTLPKGVRKARVVDLSGPSDEVYLWSTLHEQNYGHHIGEFMPSLHNTLCKYLGRCTADNTSGLHLFELFPAPKELVAAQKELRKVEKKKKLIQWPGWLNEATTCFSEHPKIWIDDDAIREKVVLVRRAMVGVGDDCRARMFCNADKNYGSFRPISTEMYRGYRARMAACLGFPADAVAPIQPRVKIMLADRHYTSGRHILNVGEVHRRLQERYGAIADVQLRYMEGLTLREQALLWSGQSIAIHVHGAALGSWPFLPHNAVAVHLVTRPAGIIHDNQFAHQHVRDLKPLTNLTFFPVNNTDFHYAHLRNEEVFKQAQWQALTAEQKIKVLEEGECGHLPDGLQGHCAMYWLLKRVDLVLRPELLLEVMDSALAELFAKQGLPLPPLDGSGTSSNGSGSGNRGGSSNGSEGAGSSGGEGDGSSSSSSGSGSEDEDGQSAHSQPGHQPEAVLPFMSPSSAGAWGQGQQQQQEAAAEVNPDAVQHQGQQQKQQQEQQQAEEGDQQWWQQGPAEDGGGGGGSSGGGGIDGQEQHSRAQGKQRIFRMPNAYAM